VIPGAVVHVTDTEIVFGALGLVSLVPVVWAIVDVARRPLWQFSRGRKVVWTLMLGVGWLVLWPLALISSVVYLAVLRRRFPPASAVPPGVPPIGRYGAGQYGTGRYGAGGYGSGQYPGGSQQYPGSYGGQDRFPGFPEQGYPPQPPLPPAGWYADPAGSPQQRWWDGKGWTDHLR
jgi:Protein of unknown function (DUF2510)